LIDEANKDPCQPQTALAVNCMTSMKLLNAGCNESEQHNLIAARPRTSLQLQQ
jgi:hypothetical protein